MKLEKINFSYFLDKTKDQIKDEIIRSLIRYQYVEKRKLEYTKEEIKYYLNIYGNYNFYLNTINDINPYNKEFINQHAISKDNLAKLTQENKIKETNIIDNITDKDNEIIGYLIKNEKLDHEAIIEAIKKSPQIKINGFLSSYNSSLEYEILIPEISSSDITLKIRSNYKTNLIEANLIENEKDIDPEKEKSNLYLVMLGFICNIITINQTDKNYKIENISSLDLIEFNGISLEPTSYL